jgi:hypothetical protein
MCGCGLDYVDSGECPVAGSCEEYSVPTGYINTRRCIMNNQHYALNYITSLFNVLECCGSVCCASKNIE